MGLLDAWNHLKVVVEDAFMRTPYMKALKKLNDDFANEQLSSIRKKNQLTTGPSIPPFPHRPKGPTRWDY